MNGDLTVELWGASLPKPLSPIAWHCWFVVRDGERATRYEIWQSQNAGGESMGHLHRDLMRPNGSVGGGSAVCLHKWQGDQAQALVKVIESSFEIYPFRYQYAFWPGPNSNTFVRWVIEKAGLLSTLTLDKRAIGKDYLGRFGVGVSRWQEGGQITTPLIGFRYQNVPELPKWELHLLGFTIRLR